MSDEEKVTRLRAQLPALADATYLNNGWAGPIAEPTRAAMQAACDREFQHGRVGQWASDLRDELAESARRAVAEVLHADLDEVALTVSATDAMNVALWGLDWTAGDQVLTTSLENSAALVPLYTLGARFGVETRVADLHYGEIDAAAACAAAMTPRTRLLLVSDVVYSTGAVLDVRAIARVAHEHGALLLIDGAQSGGAIPRAVHDLEVDCYALSGHKWLCGPEGTGGLYVRRESQPELQMSFSGVYSDTAHGLGGKLQPFPGARRHEISTRNYPALAGQAASIRWMTQDVGIEWASRRAHGLAEYARRTLGSLPGVEVFTPSNHAGLFAFRTAEPVQDLWQWLDGNRVWCRWAPNPDLVRISLAFYTTEREIDRVTELVEQRLSSR